VGGAEEAGGSGSEDEDVGLGHGVGGRGSRVHPIVWWAEWASERKAVVRHCERYPTLPLRGEDGAPGVVAA
jgi:hypothetical protein